MSNPCNCSTCTKQSTPDCPYVTTHESVLWMDEDGNTLQDEHLSMSVSITGCLSHPNAREYLIQDVIQELERRSNADRTAYVPANERKAVLEECIALIRDGVKK